MEILIFSDSHGDCEGMRQALSRQTRVPDAIFFLGDGLKDLDRLETGDATLYRVTGNCDWFSSFGDGNFPPVECLTALEGHTILLTHGHKFGVKSGYGALISRAVEAGADIVLFGHTHTPELQIVPKGECLCGKRLERPLYLFNPGSVGSGSGGASFGTLLLSGETVLFSHGSL